MQTGLATTALLMGLAGGPHCALMCGAACAGIGRAGGDRSTTTLAAFHGGRLVGYAALGALAGVSMQGLGWLGGASAALRPAWTLMHLAALALGAVLLLQARQPAWLEARGRALWQGVRRRLPARRGALVLGMLWALMPCGLLQAALLVAALTGDAVDGAVAMALFAAGSALSLWAIPRLALRLPLQGLGVTGSQWGMRLAGLALVASSGWVLFAGLVLQQAPWCVTP